MSELDQEIAAADTARAQAELRERAAKEREHAMREWSRGEVDTALALLDSLAAAWPNDLELAAERLFVLVNNRIDDPRARATVEALSERAWRHRRIALLAAFFH